MNINLTQTVVQLCSRLHITMAELSRRTNQSPQNLCRKVKNETIGYDEFLRILEVLGVKYEYTLTIPGEDEPVTVRENDRSKENAEILQDELRLAQRKIAYYSGLLNDTRAALHAINSSSDTAIKNAKNSARVNECLKKIHLSSRQLELQLSEAARADTGKAAELASPLPLNEENLKGRRILLSDDNSSSCDITRDTLESNGINVHAASGDDVVTLVKNSAAGYFDCVVIDVHAKGADGLEIAKRIRSIPNRAKAGVPLIALSSSVFESERLKCYEAGFDACLSKPADAVSLIRTISKFI
ncbi:MAG: response regulator [Clostridia bacterium]|nr:response regulator [Clostridia bacterium]